VRIESRAVRSWIRRLVCSSKEDVLFSISS